MPIPYVSFPEFTRSTLPEPISFKDQQVIIVDPDGTRALLFSNGKVWVSPAGANSYSELADKYTAQIATDNTSVATALTARATTVALNAHTGNVANPHGLTKAQIGLSNADNTSDLAKPISTATQTAISAIVATNGDVTAAGVQNITGAKTFSSGALKTAGATSGSTTLQSAPAASGVLTLPAATDTLVARDTVDTLTNKTLTNPVIASITSGVGTLSLPSATDTLVGRATTDTLSNKTLTSPLLTGVPSAPTAAQGAGTTQVATTAYADTLGATKANANNPVFTGTPTGITKTHVGLSNADNTSDTNKPISTPQAVAFAAKADTNNPTFTGTPTGITKTHVGLSGVDNTSDVAKPVSTAQAAALAAKQATLSAGANITIIGNTISATGGSASVRAASTPAIPLDLTGNGKSMPLVAGQMIALTADLTPTIAAGSVLGGVCVADYVSSGTGNLNLAAYFLTRGDTYAAEAARMFTVTYFVQTSGTYAVVQKGALSATFPFFTAQSPPAGTVGTAYSYTYIAPNATSFALFSGSLPAGVTLNTATGTIGGTPTTPATSTYMLSASGPGGTSLSTAQSVVIAAAAVSTAPGQVTGLTFGTSSTSTQPLTWTAPVSNGGSAITDYLIEYKATASGTWLTFSHTASTATAATLVGLTAGTSYDARVSATNAIGTGTASSVVTGSTTAAGTGLSKVRLTRFSTVDTVETGDATAGWNYYSTYTSTNIFNSDNPRCVSNTSLAAGAGYIRFTISAIVANELATNGTWNGIFALDAISTQNGPTAANSFAVSECAVSISGSTTTPRYFFNVEPLVNVLPQVGDLCEFSRNASNNIFFKVSKDGGATFTTVYAFPTALAGNLYFHAQVVNSSNISNLVGNNFA